MTRTKRLVQALSALLLVGCWSLATTVTGVIPSSALPGPTAVATGLYAVLTDVDFLSHMWTTVRRTILASLVAIPSGVAVGFAMGANARVKELLGPFIYGLYPLPGIALLPLVVLALGDERQAIVFLGALGGFFVLVWNAMSALQNIDRVYFDVARENGATTRWELFREVMLPGSLSYLLTGIRLCLSTALLVVISVEFITSRDGLGFFVWRAWQLYDLPELYAGVIVIGVLGIGVTYGLQWLYGWVVPWGQSVDDRTIV